MDAAATGPSQPTTTSLLDLPHELLAIIFVLSNCRKFGHACRAMRRVVQSELIHMRDEIGLRCEQEAARGGCLAPLLPAADPMAVVGAYWNGVRERRGPMAAPYARGKAWYAERCRLLARAVDALLLARKLDALEDFVDELYYHCHPPIGPSSGPGRETIVRWAIMHRLSCGDAQGAIDVLRCAVRALGKRAMVENFVANLVEFLKRMSRRQEARVLLAALSASGPDRPLLLRMPQGSYRSRKVYLRWRILGPFVRTLSTVADGNDIPAHPGSEGVGLGEK